MLDTREEVKQAQREAQGTADAETTASAAWQQACLSCTLGRQEAALKSCPTTLTPVIPLEGDPVATGLERLFSIVERAASQIGNPKEGEREEKDSAVEKRLEDLESKVSTVHNNVTQMLAMMKQQKGN
ncbi:hypothetical protein VC83_00618 [Pseudogymnoascus destructans]|uniref:Uncharacterized protein n=1 Tax=Pseudogymnoascus destructans TaxID=655981 RepID=A0A177APR8_9PEZI|nr:uncharacterized protein VC83_00618 [Pseudogymnoascus destructans]OAF63214.1 hypothetical protein VC83_00618 [Pseudogymnoascus destructans]